MRIPFDHPLHEFEEVPGFGLTSGNGTPLTTYRCRHCGLIGTRDRTGRWLYPDESASRAKMRATACGPKMVAHQGRLLLVVLEDLPDAPRLSSGPLADRDDVTHAEGLWMRGQNGDVLLRPGEYRIVKSRMRTRPRNG